MKRRFWLLLIAVLIVFPGSELRAGGFGGFVKRIKRNVKGNAKKKVKRTKDSAKDRVVGSKDQIVDQSTNNTTLGRAATGQITKETLTEDMRQRAKNKVAATSPMAGAALDGEAPGDGLKQSVRDRIEAMRANYSADALGDRVGDSVLGENAGGSGEDGAGFGQSLRDKLRAIREQREQSLFGGVEGSVGGAVDAVGGSSGSMDLNTASASELADIDGIDSSDAVAIVQYREENGGVCLDDLTGIIGFKKYLLVRTYVSGDEDEDDDDDD